MDFEGLKSWKVSQTSQRFSFSCRNKIKSRCKNRIEATFRGHQGNSTDGAIITRAKDQELCLWRELKSKMAKRRDSKSLSLHDSFSFADYVLCQELLKEKRERIEKKL